jgi:RNA polymerase-binding transcription factor DksA
VSERYPDEDQCKFKDPIDQASYLANLHNTSNVAMARRKAAPEQDGTQTECACGEDIEDERVKLFRIRCFSCQTIKEKRELNGMG